MKEDINKKLENVLNSMDKNKLNLDKRTVEQLLSTPEGKKLASRLSGVDKNKLINTFMNMDCAELKKKLQNADLSKLSQLKADDILKKLR